MYDEHNNDLGWKPGFSGVGFFGWLIFIIIWLAFFASDYSWEKNFAILLLSILVAFMLLGGMWGIWSIRKIPRSEWKVFRIRGFKWRIVASIGLPFAALLFLIIWFWSYAEPYSVWQNIAVFIVVLLFLGGTLGGIWAKWSMKYGDQVDTLGKEFEKTVKDAQYKPKDEGPED